MTTLSQPSFSKGAVDPELFGRVDTSAYRIGLATARNVIVRTTGGVVNRPGLEFVGLSASMLAPSRLRRFRFNTTDTYMLEFCAFGMYVVRNDAHVLETGKAITGASISTTCILTVVGHAWVAGDQIAISGVLGMTRLNGRRFAIASVVDANNVRLTDIVADTSLNTSAFPAYVSGGTASRVYRMTTPYAQADLATLKFVQSADVMTVTHPSYPEGRITRTGHAAWAYAVPAFAPGILPPTGLAVVANTVGTITASYKVTALDATTGEESVGSAAVTIVNGANPALNTATWTAVANAVSYSVYKGVNGVFGFVGDTPNLTFTDSNFGPALGTTPPTSKNPFLGSGNYPACSTYYQQRHVRAGSTLRPDRLEYSRTASFYNYTVSEPTQADDSIAATLTSREVNAIRHLVPGKDLLVFTAGGEWRVNSSGVGFSSATMQQLSQSSWGCSHLEPISIGLTVLFVPENQTSVRSFGYTYVSDAYQGNDLTLLSGHLFKDFALTSWSFGRSPDPLVYGIRADGSATAFTFQEEQQVSAWARWDTSGRFEGVDVVRPSGSTPDEVPYFNVLRTIGGKPVRTIERLHSRRFPDVRDSFFVDSGLSFDTPTVITQVFFTSGCQIVTAGHSFVNGQQVDLHDILWTPALDEVDNETQPDQINGSRYVVGSATSTTFYILNLDGSAVDVAGFTAYVSGGTVRPVASTVSGLDHLEGRAVVALADGNVVENLVVAGGSVALPFAASRIHVGLKYISDVGTLDLEAPQGTIQDRHKRVVSITVRFNKSRGLFVGQTPTELTEIKQREYEDMGDPTALFSGKKTLVLGSAWNIEGRVFLRQRYPLPMEILAILPDLDIEGG